MSYRVLTDRTRAVEGAAAHVAGRGVYAMKVTACKLLAACSSRENKCATPHFQDVSGFRSSTTSCPGAGL